MRSSFFSLSLLFITCPLLVEAFLFGSCNFFSVSPVDSRRIITGTTQSNKLALNAAVESSAPETNIEKVSSLPEQTSQDNEIELLQDALVTFGSSSTSKILNKLRDMRRTGDMDGSTAYLNALLKEGPDNKKRIQIIWSTPPLRSLLPRFSKRARMASLKRTLDLTTPPPEDEDTVEITEEDRLRRRRRALLSLLQSLSRNEEDTSSSAVAIRTLEKKAQQSARKRKTSRNDLLSRRPADLETPKFEVIVEYPSYEIRAYDTFSVCSVNMNQSRPFDSYKTDASVSDPKMKGARAFGALAGYLFGKNQQQSAMKMTTPVLTSNYGSDDRNEDNSSTKQMSFVLPSNYWNEDSLKTAPQPLSGSGVTLETQPASTRAVIMFGGYASKSQVEQQKKKLLNAIKGNKDWEVIESDEQVTLAQYNDPFTPPWKRLNEVSIKVQAKSSSK